MKIYVDMDGVLADLFNHVKSKIDVEHYSHISRSEWNKFFEESNAEELFENLPVFPTANKLLLFIVQNFGEYHILSSPLNFDEPASIRGKKKWIEKNLNIKPKSATFERKKYLYAKGNVLIDDFGRNIRPWREYGGIGIKYQADENPVEYVFERLKEIKNEHLLSK